MTRRSRGFTLIEVLIALAVIGIAFGALGLVQIGNLRATTMARVATETKGAANLVLETLMERILATSVVCVPTPIPDNGDPRYIDSDLGNCDTEAYVDDRGVTYAFNDYYWRCPDLPLGVWPADRLGVNPTFDGTCAGSFWVAGGEVVDTMPQQYVEVGFVIRGLEGVAGEGLLAISVTATHKPRGTTLTLGDRVTCYDVYPTPTVQTPAPCPIPSATGSGRPSGDNQGGG